MDNTNAVHCCEELTLADQFNQFVEESDWELAAFVRENADAILSALRQPTQTDALREALEAIIARGPERDVKWAGMTARDIAIAALNALPAVDCAQCEQCGLSLDECNLIAMTRLRDKDAARINGLKDALAQAEGVIADLRAGIQA